MHIRRTTVRLRMIVAALAAAGSFAAAVPANATAINHSNSVITVAPASASAVAPGQATGIQLGHTVGERNLVRLGALAQNSYPPVCNCFNIWLTGSPDYNPPACTNQIIYLTKGEYEWLQVLGNDDNGVNLSTIHYIPLDSSYYSWEDCLYPEFGYYIQSSELCPLSLPSGYPCVYLTTDQYYVTSDTWTVGSWLDWQR